MTAVAACVGDSGEKAKKTAENGLYSSVPTGQVVVELDSISSSESNALQYLKYGDTRNLIYYDSKSGNINFIDLDQKRISHKIYLAEEGPDAITHFLGLAVKNTDTIFVFDKSYKIFQINYQGHVIRNFDYGAMDIVNPIASLSLYQANAIFEGNRIYLLQTSGQNHYLDEHNPTNFKFCTVLDIRSGEFKPLNICHPATYWEDGIKPLYVSWCRGDDYFVFSPIYSHDLYLSRDCNQIDSIITLKSKYVNDFVYYNPNKVPSASAYFGDLIEKEYYLGILYDPYRKVYYRFFWPGMSIESFDSDDIFKTAVLLPTFGISVFDENFQLIDEIILPKNRYRAHQCFVAEEVLYLSANHPGNPDLKENEWRFDIFTLQKNNNAE
ncbi:MAG: DUF4221 domain-containing protein [Bacteroidales bacterium]